MINMLINILYKLFPTHPIPDPEGLRFPNDWEARESCMFLRGKSWDNIQSEELRLHWDAFSWLNATYFHYYLPSVIFLSLQEGTAILPAESGILRRKHKFLLNFGCSSDIMNNVNAGVMELVDVTDSKSVGSDTVWVRVPPPAPSSETLDPSAFEASGVSSFLP